MSYLEIPLLKSIERPGKYLVLASRKSWAIIFKATSYLYETFLLYIFEGIKELSYFRVCLILLQSCLISYSVNSTLFLGLTSLDFSSVKAPFWTKEFLIDTLLSFIIVEVYCIDFCDIILACEFLSMALGRYIGFF